MFAKVIVGFDGSDQARDALALSERLTAPDGELIVCCVHHFKGLSSHVDPAEPRLDRATAIRCAEEACGLLDGRHAVTPLVVASAGAAMALHTAGEQQDAELLVVGSSHRGPVGRVLVGSVTEETLHGAPCPVAIAPVGFDNKPTDADFGLIAVGYDVLDPQQQALHAAAALAAQSGAELQVVAVADSTGTHQHGANWATSDTATTEARLSAAEEGLSGALAEMPDGLKTCAIVRFGRVSEELLQVTHGVDLLVLGRAFAGYCSGVCATRSCGAPRARYSSSRPPWLSIIAPRARAMRHSKATQYYFPRRA